MASEAGAHTFLFVVRDVRTVLYVAAARDDEHNHRNLIQHTTNAYMVHEELCEI